MRLAESTSISLSLDDNQIVDPVRILDNLQDYCKPKSNTPLMAIEFNKPEQVDLSLPEFITKVGLLCNQCEYPADTKVRALQDFLY